jgi:hypothetical protein
MEGLHWGEQRSWVARPALAPEAPGAHHSEWRASAEPERRGTVQQAPSAFQPLPTHRFPQYVRGSGRLEDDPIYRRHPHDFERYHTRYVSPEPVRDALRVKIDPRHP